MGWAHLGYCFFPEAMNNCLGSRFSPCSWMPPLAHKQLVLVRSRATTAFCWCAGSGVGSIPPSHRAQIMTYLTGNMVLSCIMAVWLGQWQENCGEMPHFSQRALQTMAKVAAWCWWGHLAGNTCVSAQGITRGRWTSSSWWRTEAEG